MQNTRGGHHLSILGFGEGFWLANVAGSWALGVWEVAGSGYKISAPAMYTAISTGFCGSLTTFSGWNNHAGRIMSRGSPILALALLASHTALWMACYRVGRSTADAMCEKDTTPEERADAHLAAAQALLDSDARVAIASIRRSNRAVDVDRKCSVESAIPPENSTFIFLSFAIATAGVWATSLALGSGEPCQAVVAGCILAPIGAGTRYLLGILNNSDASTLCSGGAVRQRETYKSVFPMFTFAANMIGSILLASVRASGADSGGQSCGRAWAKAMVVGFCGCLTTVSSFVSEAAALARVDAASTRPPRRGRRRALLYVGVSVLCAQVLIVCAYLIGDAAS